jgi:8-oxo-dGTP pyrophosphatase MutT (NUDIX family)
MIKDQSFGIIPLQKINGIWHVLLIKQRFGRHWSFPKGHAEGNETPKESAGREFFEETGLTISSYISDEALSETYEFRSRGTKIVKTVCYFVADVTGTIKLEPQEVIACKWIPLDEAQHHVTFPQAKELCEKANALLRKWTMDELD